MLANVQSQREPALEPPSPFTTRGALILGSNPLFIDRRKHIIALANSNKIPTMFFEHDSVADGGR